MITEVTTKPSAFDFAMERHGNQEHGCLSIKDHLIDVGSHVLRHYDPNVNVCSPWQIVQAAYLHDTIEDTGTTIDEIEAIFGWSVAWIVNLVTDKDGKNRMERHLRTYHMIRTDPDAVLVKLCDRRHNHARSLTYNEKKYTKMYADEYIYFKFALYKPGQFVKLWEELDDQYEKMKWRVENEQME
jgi:(p)ppGpp synthase/HD superfamily hydrolase